MTFTKEDLRDIAYRGSYDDLERELALQLLDSMEQEPVAWRYRTTDIKGNPHPDWSFSEEASLLGLYQPLYAAPPAPVSVPETLPCPVMLEPRLRFGKGVRTQTMLDALQRRAEYSAELEAMTPEQRSDHEAGMKEFAAMLQGNHRDLSYPVDPQIAAYEKIMEQAIPDGYALVPVDMAPEMMRAVQLDSELGGYAAANLSGAYSLFREFWDVAIAAAPDFRDIPDSSTNNCRENAETSTNCPKCGGRGSYHCPQMLGTVECECTLPAAPQQEAK